MTNELKIAIIESILQLHALHWSARQIARELGIDRGTVGKHLQRTIAAKTSHFAHRLGNCKTSHFPPGSGYFRNPTRKVPILRPPCRNQNQPFRPPGRQARIMMLGDSLASAGDTPDPRQETTPVLRGRPSECVPYRSIIEAKLDLELAHNASFRIW